MHYQPLEPVTRAVRLKKSAWTNCGEGLASHSDAAAPIPRALGLRWGPLMWSSSAATVFPVKVPLWRFTSEMGGWFSVTDVTRYSWGIGHAEGCGIGGQNGRFCKGRSPEGLE